MPPSRKFSTPHPNHPNHPNPKRPRLNPSKSSKPPPQSTTSAPPLPSHHQKPTIPFLPTDHILLVGEGDFSFAHSLLRHHAFTFLVATSLDSRDVVLEKYPHAVKNLSGLENWEVGGRDGVGERSSGQKGEETEEDNGYEEGEKIGEINGDDEKAGDEEEDENEDEDEEEEEDQEKEKSETIKKEVRVKFGVDATKLTRARVLGRTKIKKKKKGGPSERGFDKIVFNFPHVGGKSKDVNRQVRYNQDLLVSFLTTSLPLLAPRGSILITLFEGLPYTLWNIRDLARHVGLRVGRSFRFEAGAYPGYKHARTGGVVKGQGRRKEGPKEGLEGDEEDEDESGGEAEGEPEVEVEAESGEEEKQAEKQEVGREEERRGWKGEQRASRTYIFELIDSSTTSITGPTTTTKIINNNANKLVEKNQNQKKQKKEKKKRKRGRGRGRGSSDSDSDLDDEED